MATSTPLHRRRLHIGRTLQYFLLPVLVFVVTSIPGVNTATPLLALLCVVLLLVFRFLPRIGRDARVVCWVVLVLALVGSTGWFYSPFFFALYLTAIALGFVYAPSTAVGFTLSLLVLFAFSIGDVNPTYDFLTLLSLLAVIPLTLGLRHSFLLVQQERKGILILEQERNGEGLTTLDAILANRINNIGVLLRQPITYVKQGLELLREGKLSSQEQVDVMERMQRSSEELFTLVKQFEQGTTKNDLLGTIPDSNEHTQP